MEALCLKHILLQVQGLPHSGWCRAVGLGGRPGLGPCRGPRAQQGGPITPAGAAHPGLGKVHRAEPHQLSPGSQAQEHRKGADSLLTCLFFSLFIE